SAAPHMPGAPTDKARLLLDFHRAEHAQLLAAAARGLSVLLMIAGAAYLFRLVRRRDAAHSRSILALGVVACAIVVATTAIGFVELRDVAREFASAGPRTTTRARDLTEGAGGLRA